jgi:predicted nucleotidyltransferase
MSNTERGTTRFGCEQGWPDGICASTLAELVRRIVPIAQPRRILLFGSAARGEMRPDSDLDVLIVIAEGIHRRALAQRLYRHLHGLPLPVDLMVATEQDLNKYANQPGMALRYAQREGVTLYEADD